MFEESFEEAWLQRYGNVPAQSFPEVARLLTHRCVRSYSNRIVSEDRAATLVAAAQSAGTSSNLQLCTIISVQDSKRRDELATLCDNQRQVREAPWFFAFCADHYRLRGAALKVGEAAAGLDYEEFFIMAATDAALACERMVCAAETMGLGVCYIGALRNDPPAVSKLLDLPDGVFGAFGLCVGWPAEESIPQIKPRLSQPAVWFREQYNRAPETEEYDLRMKAFYESQKMKGDVLWSMRSGRRVDDKHLSGREVLRSWLTKIGFGRR